MADFDIRGRVALVTGGGTGIGRGVADGLAEAGATVIIAGRRRAVTESAAAELRAKGMSAEGMQVDVMDVGDIGRLFALTHRNPRIGHGDADASTDRSGRVRHCSYDRRSGRQRFLEEADRPTGHDGQHERRFVDIARERGYSLRCALRLYGDYDRAGYADFVFRIELNPAARQCLQGFDRLRLDDDYLFRIEAAGEPAVEHGASHLPRADENEGAAKFA